ncbi:MAG: hypothetical protein HY816_21535 [Candidatus Wallbacteria bacterium]|nr:hypothetical protein [Candidatus Wallbacteria bacterium]
MKVTFKIFIVAVAGLLLFLGSMGETLIVRVTLGNVGVRTQKLDFFGTKGVVQEDFGPGWHRNLWFVDEWNFFDNTVQTFHMSARSKHPFQLKSHDGYSVSLDVTIKYRIREGKAHRVLVHLGTLQRYQGFVENLCRDACRSAFGVMKTEAFYQPSSRTEATERARKYLIDGLVKNNADVDIVEILIRDVKFDEQYERKIKDKKLADQDIVLNQSKALAAQQKGLTNKISAETEAMMKVIEQRRDATLTAMKAENDQTIARVTADFQKYVTEKKADADLYAAEKDAAGTLMIRKAEAEGEKLRNEAMSGPGGAVLAALEAAKNLTLMDVTFSTLQFDPLDLGGVLKKLGVPATPVASK